MFKRIIVIIFLILGISLIGQFVKETTLSDPQRIYDTVMPKYQHLSGLENKDIVYSPDREINLLMNYLNLIPLGKVKFWLEEFSSGELKISAEAKANGLTSSFYKAAASTSSLIDKNNFYPKKYTENLAYGEKKELKEIIYDQNKHIAVRKNYKYKIPPMTFCPLSVFYYLQLQDMRVGDIHRIKLLSKEEIYVLEAKVLENENDIIRLSGQVKRENLTSSHGLEFELWMSDELRIPLLFKVKTQAGLIVARAI